MSQNFEHAGPSDFLDSLLDQLPARAVVVSSRASRRLELAQRWLARREFGERTTLLAPSRRAGDDLVRSGLGKTGQVGIQSSTPLRFANELASSALAALGRAPVAGLGYQALVVRSVHEALEAGQLERFADVARLPGFPRALAVTLQELRLCGVVSSALDEMPRNGRDLARLLDHYRSQLDAWQLADRAAVLETATKAIEHRPPAAARWPNLWLDLPIDWPAEEHFLRALAASTPRLLATVPSEHGEGLRRRRLEAMLGAVAVDLDGLDWPSAGKDGESESHPVDRLMRAQSFVFSQDVPPLEETDPEDRSVEFFSASSEGQECVEIARRLRDHAAEGVSFDRMAVLLRSPTTYLPLLEAALRRAEIPAWFSRGTSRPDPAGRAFLSLLACADQRLSATAFAEYLSLGQVPGLEADGHARHQEVPWVEASDDGGQFVFKSVVEVAVDPAEEAYDPEEDGEGPVFAGTLPVPYRWERLLVDASVVGGTDRWRRRLAGLEHELELRAREVDPEDEHRRLGIEARLEQLRTLERFALPLIDFLAAFPEQATWGEWLDRLERLATMALRRPATVLQVLAELRPMAEVGPVALEQVQRVLAERLTLLRTDPPRRRFGRVFVGLLEEALGRSFEVVFVPGLAEGVFPRRTLEDPLLLDAQREHLAQLSPKALRLPHQRQRIEAERRLLHLGVGAAVRQLVASYPRVDVAAGRQRVPSFYALDLLRAAEGALPELRELRQRAVLASATGVGWPAPERPESAIDDAEYDLALLQPLLRRPAHESRGQGQFLLHANQCLARSLRARGRRWRKMWSRVDGLVEPNAEAAALLADHRPNARPYSPTALQHFAACPYRFFLQAIVRLRPRDALETLEQLDPLTRGSLFHETQHQLFSALTDEALLPVTESNLGAALDVLDLVLDRCAADYAERLAPAIPRIWESEIENLRSDLRGWLRHTASEDRHWQPRWSELAFGLPLAGPLGEGRDPESRVEPVTVLGRVGEPGSIQLRGSIDLVEVHEDGERLRVTDHKTGRVARDWDGKELREGGVVTAGGKVLQPLLYALAAEEMLSGSGQSHGEGASPEGGGRIVESGRLFYCTQKGGYQPITVRLDQYSRASVSRVISTVEGALDSGFLPAAPAQGECKWCDYRLVCGPSEELRTSRKPPRELDPLVELRRTR